MARPAPERPTFPWLGLVVVALAVLGVVSLLRMVVGLVLALVQFAVVVALVALAGWVLLGRRRRST
ncbi:MAG TPA: hypothetical protein VF640_06205 [Acidimicrobiales bacterium]